MVRCGPNTERRFKQGSTLCDVSKYVVYRSRSEFKYRETTLDLLIEQNVSMIKVILLPRFRVTITLIRANHFTVVPRFEKQ